MSPLLRRRLRYYLRLDYPVHVTWGSEGFVGSYPDLPGASVADTELPRLYARLENTRRDWLAARVRENLPVPMPNTGVEAKGSRPARAEA